MDGFKQLNSPYETHEDDGELGDGLTTAEILYWAERKRDQNLTCRGRAHEKFCPRCKNCLCDKWQTGVFRCMCDFGKTMVTPYRIRYWTEADRRRHAGY